MCGGVGHGERWRPQAGKISPPAVESINGVVRSGIRSDFRNDPAVERVQNVPVRAFKRRLVNHLSIRGNGHAVATAGVGLFPKNFFSDEIEAGQGSGGADVNALGRRVRANPFDIEGPALLVQARRRNALHELVAVVDVEYQHAVPAVFQIVANAGRGNIQESAFG